MSVSHIDNKQTVKSSEMKLISALAPWIQLLNMYALIGGVTLGYGVIVFLDIVYILFCGRFNMKVSVPNKQSKWIWAFMLFFTLTMPVCIILAGKVNFLLIANRLVKMYSIFMLILVLNGNNIDWEVYKKSLKIFVVIACLVLLYQYVSKIALGYFYDVRIPFLEYARENTNEKLTGLSKDDRFRSVFTEPAYFVYFIFQYFPILLFEDFENRKLTTKELLLSALISVCVVLSVSSTGLILLLMTWAIYLFLSVLKGKITVRDIALAFVAFIAVSYLVSFYLDSEILSFSIHRMTKSYKNSSVVWWRLIAGFEEIEKMEWYQLIFGYGMGNFPNESFMNGVAYTILCTGIVGFALVICWMISNFVNTDICGKVTTLIWVLLIITEIMLLYAPTMIGYAIIINYFQKKKTEKQLSADESASQATVITTNKAVDV